jgi:hypothetical protein
MIDAIKFGAISIQGQTYSTDVLIFPDGQVKDGWWRKHGHRLTLGDLDALLRTNPEVLVVGTGVHGRMLPEAGLEDAIRNMGIELVIAPNGQAMRHFNRLAGERSVAGGFHLTC